MFSESCCNRLGRSYILLADNLKIQQTTWKYDLIVRWTTSFLKVKVQVYSLISSLKTYHPTLHLTGPVHSWAISTPRRAYSPAAVSAHWTYRTHCHLCPTMYSFSPESSEAFEGEVPCPRTQHLNNVPRLRGEKHDISLKIMHQRDSKPHGRQRYRQSATL